MTESRTLLAEYAASASEAAFRELVTRYFGLVYSTALRLVGGDTHLAEDVAQTVFTDLARKARGLSKEVMLGGWLHQRTFNVAAPLMRARRRREAREREAAQMSTLHNDSAAGLAQIAPLLDEAITALQTEDRTAILLRFFERRDFRSIGAVLGSTEEAARMRVSRALEKLHRLLKQRGATLSAAALAAVLTGEGLTAAPAGLAASVAGAALAAPAAAGITATIVKLTLMTKLQAGIAGAAAIAAVVTSLVIHQQSKARFRAQEDTLQGQAEQLARLAADNERLSNLVTAAEVSGDQVAELQKLRAETESLRKKTNELAKLQAQMPAPRPAATPEEIQEEQILKMNTGKRWMVAFIMYAQDHQGQYATNFDQAMQYVAPLPNSDTNLVTDKFEMVYRGTIDVPHPDEVVVLKEKEPWQNTSGMPCKIYAFADGHVQVVGMPSRWTVGGKEVSYTTFEDYERDHIVPSSAP